MNNDKNKFRRFKVSPENKAYLRRVLWERNIKNKFKAEGGNLFCYAKCSGQKFHEAHSRAVCERLTDETGIIHMTKNEAKNVGVRWSIMSRYGRKDGGGAVII